MAGHAAGGLVSRAPAKINLTLAVLGRRADGYHELDSLVAFAGCHDTLALDPHAPFGLTVSGPTAGAAGDGADNLVLKAAAALRARIPSLRTGGFRLVKRLPVAAGIGGGSADAAAALRLLARLNGLSAGHPALREAAAATGADVPVCLASRAARMRGIGHDLSPVPRLVLWAVLVNPRVPVPTADVFRELGLAAGAANPAPSAALDVASGGNDLERPAIAIAPTVGEVLAALRSLPGCTLARMSGSGATCFGLFADCREAAAAASRLRRARPDWWIKPTVLR